ncbi:leucine efflux protein LeuE [Kitasatospora aureofaciens]|uniref:Leucine efflux protein n=2 Tax=Streptomycetaceae TaxID=2062 RepID=A0A1E7NBP2_KITAU|nr:leucine efflux protein LeuE [Kitasatospora aureofaciens]ARF79681.1 leucine efflux protein [Kitasatospora aureofaciens]OEV38112.1 leucine efflux protein LeuE [Kitasatospora aureofaciens]GGU87722.1 leucine efflux protein [Kitasatospora aureofaciens]
MFGVNDLTTYVLGALVIILLPGPNSLYVLSVAARKGIRTGYRAAAGVFVGDLTLISLTSLGAASLLKANPAVFAVVKFGGAAYLLWIGFGMLRAARQLWRERRAEADPADGAEAAVEAGERPFRRALVISLLNPKAILFLLSFFTQFVDPSYGQPALSFALLGGILQTFSLLYLSLLIFAGTTLATAFRRRRRLSATLTSGVAVLFAGFAAKLAVSSA